MTTNTTVISATQAAEGLSLVETTREEFLSFVMDRKAGITVATIEAELVRFSVPFTPSWNKERKANLWYDAAEAVGAAIESAKEGDVEMTKVEEEVVEARIELEVEHDVEPTVEERLEALGITKSTYAQYTQFGREGLIRDAAMHAVRKKNVKRDEKGKEILRIAGGDADNIPRPLPQSARVNHILESRMAMADAAKARYIEEFGEFALEVVNYSFQARPNVYKEWTRVGTITTKLPKDFAQIRIWDREAVRNDGGKGMFVPHDFSNFNLDGTKQYDAFERPVAGEGLLKTVVMRKHEDGKLYVFAPQNEYTNKAGETVKTPIVTVARRGLKYGEGERVGEYVYVPDNNWEFTSMLTAWVRLLAREFVYQNPANRNIRGGSYMQSVRLGTNDGLAPVEEGSRDVLAEIPVEDLTQGGGYQSQVFCAITGDWLDEDVVARLNADVRILPEYEHFRDVGQSQKGQASMDNSKRVLVGGELVNPWDLREEEVALITQEFYWYRNNVRKSPSRYNTELVNAKENGGGYVSEYYSDGARAENQAVQTLSRRNGKAEWTMDFPGMVKDPIDVRIKGVGIALYSSPVVRDGLLARKSIGVMEAFDVEAAKFNNAVNQIWTAAYGLKDMSEEELAVIFAIIDDKPGNLTERQDRVWTMAVDSLVRGLQWAQEAEDRKNARPFKQVFFAGERAGATEIDVEEVAIGMIEKNEAGTLGFGLGYEGMVGSEISGQLDLQGEVVAMEYIEYGGEFVVTGGSELERDLVSGALQQLLQRNLADYVFNIGREEDVSVAIEKFDVNEDVKAYLYEMLG